MYLKVSDVSEYYFFNPVLDLSYYRETGLQNTSMWEKKNINELLSSLVIPNLTTQDLQSANSSGICFARQSLVKRVKKLALLTQA